MSLEWIWVKTVQNLRAASCALQRLQRSGQTSQLQDGTRNKGELAWAASEEI